MFPAVHTMSQVGHLPLPKTIVCEPVVDLPVVRYTRHYSWRLDRAARNASTDGESPRVNKNTLTAARTICRANRYGQAACLALALVCRPSAVAADDGLSQAAALQIVVTPAGVTDELVLRDGTRAYGRVENVDRGVVTFITTAGATIEVQAGEIVSVSAVNGRVVAGEFRRADPNPTRLFFGPTARSLKQGAGYVGVYEILLPFVQVGLTDRISFGAGTPLIFGDGSAHPLWITPKVQAYASESVQASVGVMHFLNVGDGNFGIAYVVGTRGTTDSAVTGGVGYAYDRSYNAKNGAAVVMIGAEHRITRGMKILSENYIFNGGGILTGGVRWLGERFSADLAMVVPTDGDTTVAFPLVNVVYSFSR
jgi:hypothetical protein